ncbi:MAG: DNA polymerase III subunit chi [Acidobacteriia bacterium]|nr:DNA polymerase III subunit chi [Methyloceanibacter sp.]MBX5471808.1 DNA polymerase III subunit chi [Acetobacteraceae bacterium]MCL6490975.1 DNA polymerase III subunit chi [Terriglobia bacterium]
MAEIGFYHLTRSRTEEALPRLLGRTLELGERAVVICGSEERLAALDAALWLCTEPDWLPHGTRASGAPELQPIWLTTEDEAPNGARFLFLIDGATSARLADFVRVFDLFDGSNENEVAAARARFAAAKAAGHIVTYWQQDHRGWKRIS